MKRAHPFGARSTADEVLAGLDLSGKTFLVTGCNSGIGLETVRALGARGGQVIGLARTLESAREAGARAGGAFTPVACDLADLDSVEEAIQVIRGLGRPLDAVVANAGIMGPPKLTVRYGVELQFLVNHVGHFALIQGLLDRVPDGTGRIVVVSSNSSIHQAPRKGILFDNLDGHRGYKPFAFYGQSKLANVQFARELSRRLAPRRIAVNSLHPGAVGGTHLSRSVGFPFTLIVPLVQWLMKTVPQGTATQVLLAASPHAEGITGEYWADCHVAKGSRHLDDEAMATRLWKVTEDLLARHRAGALPAKATAS